MKKNYMKKKIVVCFLLLSMLVTSSAISVQAEDVDKNEKIESEHVNAAIDSGYRAPSLQVSEQNTTYKLARASAIPAAYSSKKQGYVSPVRNQGTLGTCWAYAAVACMESYAIKHGMADQNIDLSEYALAYMAYDDTSFTDPMGGTTGDKTTIASDYTLKDAMQNGGNDNIAFKPLNKWAAIMKETSDTDINSVNAIHSISFNRDNVAYYLSGQYYISMKDTDLVKKAIMEYGAVASMYNADYPYHYYTSAYHYTFDETGINHSIAIVGWDDSIDKNNFKRNYNGNTYIPERNGAWLIKNSWGTGEGDYGYFWISYCDKSMRNMNAVAYEIVPAATYDHNYQYDGSTQFGKSNCTYMKSTTYANVFHVPAGNSNQYLSAVSFATREANKSYSIQVYKNPTSATDPTSGTPIYDSEISGKTVYAGYYTKKLPKTIVMQPEDSFAVVLSFDSPTVIEQSIAGDYVGACSDSVNEIGENESFFRYTDGNIYSTSNIFKTSKVNFCIKVMANDANHSQPQITDIGQSNSEPGVKISWQNIGDGTVYSLQKSESANGVFTEIYNGKALSYIDSDVELGKTYYYKVVVGSVSSPVCSYVVDILPTQISSITAGQASVTIAYDEVEGASSYGIYRWKDGQEPSQIANVTTTSYTDRDTTLTLGETYNYAVKVYRGEQESVLSQSREAVIQLATPQNIKVDNSNYHKMVISWDAVDGATGYNVYESYNGAVKVVAKVEGKTSCTIDTSKYADNTRLSYAVEPYAKNDTLDYSKEPSTYVATVTRYQPINITSAQISGGTLTVAYDTFAVAGYTSYSTGYYIWIAENEEGPYVKQSGVSYTTSRSISSYKDSSGNMKTIDGSKYYYIKVDAYTTNNLSYKYSAVQENPTGVGSNPPQAHVHSYIATVTQQQSCTTDEVTKYTCSCGDSYKRTTKKALGHSWNAGVVTTQPTYDSEGVRTYTCTRCGATKTEAIEKLQEQQHVHSYASNVIQQQSCTMDEITKYICSCGDSYTRTTKKALGHSWNAGAVTTQPTYDCEGVKTYTCMRCGATKTETIERLERPQPAPVVDYSNVEYKTHIQDYGWESDWKSNGQMSGTSGQSKRLEAIYIRLSNQTYSGGIQYKTHIQNIGWESDWKSNGQMSGTSGQALRLEAIQIQLTGEIANYYDVYYRVHAQNFGWLDWARNGQSAGTVGYSYRLEAIQIQLVKKGQAAPGSTASPFCQTLVQYRTHVQDYGWQSYVNDGAMSGTSGQSKRLEGINISLCNQQYNGTIQYRTHIQNIGWESGWKSNGQMSGTSGRSLRLEAIQIQLTGDMAAHYDVYYRVHAQNFGWLDWAKNGQSAGTAGYSYRLEGIQIVLVPKGSAAPGSTQRAFVQR